jgi:hypothetical protein
MVQDKYIHKFRIPAMDASVSLCKREVVAELEDRMGRRLSEEEGLAAWNHLQATSNWEEMFPEDGRDAPNLYKYKFLIKESETFKTFFKQAVEEGVKKTLDQHMADGWSKMLTEGLAEVQAKLEEDVPLTLETLESATQKRIQDENVKHGLARCKRETKDKSIQKWKEWYFSTRIQIPENELPEGKTKEDLIRAIEAFYK